MKKLVALLNKNIKRTFDNTSREKILANTYLKTWNKQQQNIKLKSEYDYILGSITFQAIENKETLENNYLIIREELSEFWSTLDYLERRRIVNLDMEETIKKLHKFMYKKRNKDVLIAFFDEKLNDLYMNEMLAFDLKQYRMLTLDYSTYIQDFNLYDYDVFNGEYVPTKIIKKEDNCVILYNYSVYKFYVLKNNEISVYPLFDKQSTPYYLENEILFTLSLSLYEENENKFLNECKAFKLLSEQLVTKILNELNRKTFFGR